MAAVTPRSITWLPGAQPSAPEPLVESHVAAAPVPASSFLVVFGVSWLRSSVGDKWRGGPGGWLVAVPCLFPCRMVILTMNTIIT